MPSPVVSTFRRIPIAKNSQHSCIKMQSDAWRGAESSDDGAIKERAFMFSTAVVTTYESNNGAFNDKRFCGERNSMMFGGGVKHTIPSSIFLPQQSWQTLLPRTETVKSRETE